MIRKINAALVLVSLFSLTACGEENNEGINDQNFEGSNVVGGLEMSGDIGDYNPELDIDDPAHDPALLEADGEYIVFSTGILRDQTDPGGIFIRKSNDDLSGPWSSVGEIEPPDWTLDYSPEHLWAPSAIEYEGTYYLYYATSSFGSNVSAIGVVQSDEPENPDSWEDLGPLIESDSSTGYNAIDPHVFEEDEELWIVFGSHFSGIQLTRLSSPDQVDDSYEMVHLQSRPEIQHNPVEAPTIIERDGYYFLFTSWDQCCQGLDSTYRIAVGRADQLEGPYEDRDGNPLTDGGGDILLEAEENQTGPGGQDIFQENDSYYLIHHYYDENADGLIRMQIRTIAWEDGWPALE